MSEEFFKPVHANKFDIPYSIQQKICLCDEPTWWTKSPYSWVPYCGNCQKPMRWLVQKCIGPNGCGNIYIRDFLHDGRCIRPRCQLCWDCFQKYGKTCDHTYRGEGWEPIICPPAGLNPKKYTAAELEDVFDF